MGPVKKKKATAEATGKTVASPPKDKQVKAAPTVKQGPPPWVKADNPEEE